VPIKQKSRIETRLGLQQNLPQLSPGDFGWAVDSQRLFIGNGTIAEGAPFIGNTEILTVVAAATTPANLPVSGVFQESPNGNLQVFTTYGNVAPIPNTLLVWCNYPLILGVGYTVSGSTVTFTTAPISTDNLYWQGWVS
jgi:hypothetical protein